MIFVPAQQPEIRYRPSYVEIADEAICSQYRQANDVLSSSREGSEYLRLKMASIEADQKLRRMSALRPNWDSYDAEAPNADSIQNARIIAQKAINHGLLPAAIIPSAEGGIAICFATQFKYADIECLNSGEILAVRYGNDEEPQVWALGLNDRETETSIQTITAFLAA